jgi:hypothetical protein
VVIHALNNPNSIRDWRISFVILDCLDSIHDALVWEAQKIKKKFQLLCSFYSTLGRSQIPF